MVIDDRFLSLRGDPFISYEVGPPKDRTKRSQVYAAVRALTNYDAPFIDVTTHAEKEFHSIGRRRPGTVPLCRVVEENGSRPVPHLLCHGFNKADTDEYLDFLYEMGWHQVLALQGDPVKREIFSEKNVYASDLMYVLC